MAALYFDATGLAYSFDDGHIAVRTVHSVKHVPTHQSSITRHGKVALSVKYVAAHLSSITTIPSGTDCQICHELRHLRAHKMSRLRAVFLVSNLFRRCPSMKPSSLLPGLIAGIVLGLALWLGSGSLWLLLGGVVLGLMGASLLKLAADPSRSRKNRDANFRD